MTAVCLTHEISRMGIDRHTRTCVLHKVHGLAKESSPASAIACKLPLGENAGAMDRSLQGKEREGGGGRGGGGEDLSGCLSTPLWMGSRPGLGLLSRTTYTMHESDPSQPPPPHNPPATNPVF